MVSPVGLAVASYGDSYLESDQYRIRALSWVGLDRDGSDYVGARGQQLTTKDQGLVAVKITSMAIPSLYNSSRQHGLWEAYGTCGKIERSES